MSGSYQPFVTVHAPAWLSGMLFALHPVHTEAVAGVVGQAELLCAALVLCALLVYFSAVQMGGRWAQVRGDTHAHTHTHTVCDTQIHTSPCSAV